jgi:ribonuclease HIII
MASSFVTQIGSDQGKKLKSHLEDEGFEMKPLAHAHFSAQKKGISITYYLSGKLVVQGKEMDEFIRYYLEPEILESLDYTHPANLQDLKPHIGIDEAGKGDFFGPLCVAGLYADEAGIKKLISMGIKDSKALGDKTISKLASELKQSFPYEIISIYPTKYNELYEKFKNLNSLLGWGHSKAIQNLIAKTNCVDVLIDQFAGEHVVKNALTRLGVSANLTQRHKGETDPVVAAASILARDAFVTGIAKLEAHYNITLPKGASAKVIAAGKKFIETYSKGRLNEVSKLHFKTTLEL